MQGCDVGGVEGGEQSTETAQSDNNFQRLLKMRVCERKYH